MKSTLRIILISIFVILFIPSLGYTYEFKFQKNKEIKLEVLSEQDFSTKFGNNQEIPRISEDVIALAKRVYPSLQEKRLEKRKRVEKIEVRACGEHGIGLLFAALQNPAISDATRHAVDTIIANSKPQFNNHITIGHFKFSYTDDCSTYENDCVTEDEVRETAVWLNKWWDKYVDNFTTLPEIINIEIYYLGEEILGQTASQWDHIELNSKFTVKDTCLRKTVSAHELFHRVQYEYGYETGILNMGWMVEATASWSKKYTNSEIGDYIEDMNGGLKTPERGLIIEREYDACHFWVYLEERTNWEAIKDVWSNYSKTGHTSEDARKSVDSVVQEKLGIDFNTFFQEWIKTNYLKDLDNAAEYDYDEDEATLNICEKYGPLESVPTKKVAIEKDTKWSSLADSDFGAYAAHYYEFKIDRKLKKLNILIDGKDGSNFSYHFIGIKNKENMYQKPITSIQSSGDNEYLFTKKLKPREWDKVAVIVGSGGIGGYYTISIGNALIYVDAVNGNDTTGTGRKEKPFKTISKGVSVADDGCTIKVAEGTYDNAGIDNEVLIDDLNINLLGAGIGKSTLALYGGIGIWIDDSKEVKIMGFTLTTGTDGGLGGINLSNSEVSIISNEFNKSLGIGLSNNSTATIKSNQIHDTLGFGITISENSEGKIISNEIYNNSLGGILVDNSTATITSNKIHDNPTGIGGNNSASMAITSNEIYNSTSFSGWGVFLANDSMSEITNNKLHDNRSSDISLVFSSKATIKGNVLISDIGIFNLSTQTIYAPGNTFQNTTEYAIDKYDIYDHGYWDEKKEKFTVRCAECGEVNFWE